MSIDSDTILFLSDAHFGRRGLGGEDRRRKKFFRFLEGIPGGATLFLLGDIFDFYFEYSSAIHSNYFDLFTGLSDLSRRAQIHFIGGNHDCWTGRFMRDQLGIEVHEEQFLFEAQGRKVLCAHGDLLLPGDRAYKLFRSIIRNPLAVRLARLFHPDLLWWISGLVSRGSKRITKRDQASMAARVADTAFERYFGRGNDLFVMGHIHHPTHRQSDGREFIILGDWLENFSYAVLTGGKITLERFTG